MTNTIAVFLFLTVAGLIAADHFYFRSGATLEAGRHFVELVNAIAFWR